MVEFDLDPALHEPICQFLDTHLGWDSDRLLNAAVALYLMQQNSASPEIRRVYLEKTFEVTHAHEPSS